MKSRSHPRVAHTVIKPSQLSLVLLTSAAMTACATGGAKERVREPAPIVYRSMTPGQGADSTAQVDTRDLRSSPRPVRSPAPGQDYARPFDPRAAAAGAEAEAEVEALAARQAPVLSAPASADPATPVSNRDDWQTFETASIVSQGQGTGVSGPDQRLEDLPANTQDWRNWRGPIPGADAPLADPGSPQSQSPLLNRPTQITIEKGDTLFSLSETYVVSLQALIEANALSAPFVIRVGETFQIPPVQRHVVSEGETLFAIAQRWRVDFNSLAVMNGIPKPYLIAPGQTIALPSIARDGGAFDPPRTPAEPIAVAQARVPSASVNENADKMPTPRPIAASGAGFLWPVTGDVVKTFGQQPNGQVHGGVNIATDEGAPVRAAKDGRVVYAGSALRGYGNMVLIDHGDGWVTAYAHNRRLKVAEDMTVRAGDIIAEAGSNGSVETTQVQFQTLRNGKPVDPLSVLPATRRV